MVNKINLYGGLLVLVILSSSFYIMLPDQVRIDFFKTRTKYNIYEDDKFVPVAYEYTRIFDGTALMRAKERIINYSYDNKTTEWYRYVLFKENIVAEDWLLFDNSVTNVENVPISHKICLTNATNKILEYMVTDLDNSISITQDIISPLKFGKKMKLDFQEGYYRAKYYAYKTTDNKIKIRYKITSDYECFNVRLFDPPRLIFKDCKEVIRYWNQMSDECLKFVKAPNGTNLCQEWKIKQINRTTCIKDGIVRVGNQNISFPGYYCAYQGDNRIDCVNLNYGVHKPDPSKTKCQKEGGMLCRIVNVINATHYDIVETQDKYVRNVTRRVRKQLR